MDYTGSAPQRPPPGPYIASYPPEELKTEFQRKYPPDPFGEEMGASARVWRVFKDEATNHDESLLIAWNKTLDILLIFAGLFSAIATAFVIESYKLLQPDYEEYIANALFIAFSNTTRVSLEAIGLPNPADFTPSSSSRLLNGIWFTSLILSLTVAFLCILFKQWLEEYNSRISAPFASMRQWARRRTFYFEGLTNWAVPVLIALLPLLLHASLFLFLAGLSVLLWGLDSTNAAAWMVILTCCLFTFYALSTLLPFLRRDCPSSTPIIRLLRTPLRTISLHVLMRLTSVVVSQHVNPPTDNAGSSPIHRGVAWNLRSLTIFTQRVYLLLTRTVMLLVPPQLRQRMLRTYWTLHYLFSTVAGPSLVGGDFSDRQHEELEARAIRWLVTSRSTAEAVVVGFQAVGALYPWSMAATVLQNVSGLLDLMRQCFHAVYLPGTTNGAGTLASLGLLDPSKTP